MATNIMLVTHMWCNHHSQKQARKELGNGTHASVDWFNICGQGAVGIMVSEFEPLGGPGKIVDIDESLVDKRRYNRGKRKVSQQWVSGGMEQGSTKCTGKSLIMRAMTQKIMTQLGIDSIMLLAPTGVAVATSMYRPFNPNYGGIYQLPPVFDHPFYRKSTPLHPIAKQGQLVGQKISSAVILAHMCADKMIPSSKMFSTGFVKVKK
ncbi:hypothetical protein FOCC_FOCC005347 [Frankliniella occidentalis]|nr:hypothetical protein FOCC_FOCC005347 [Frankliniella occidentalis]